MVEVQELTPIERMDQIVKLVVAARTSFHDSVDEKEVVRNLKEQIPEIILELRRLREQISGRNWRLVK